MRYFIHLAYNGSPFFGWQRQTKQLSVQEVLEDALSKLLKTKIEITGCGRTDTGVHAKKYYAHFNLDTPLSDCQREKLTHKCNSFLLKEIVVFSIFEVENDMHARFSALDRTYRYYVSNVKDPFQFQSTYRMTSKLNLEEMNAAAALLLGNNDFTSFSKLHTDVNNNFCEVKTAYWEQENNQLVFTITANRFLRNMVRSIVGTLLEVGKGKISIQDFHNIIELKDRCKAGASVPAHALFLEEVNYSNI